MAKLIPFQSFFLLPKLKTSNHPPYPRNNPRGERRFPSCSRNASCGENEKDGFLALSRGGSRLEKKNWRRVTFPRSWAQYHHRVQ
ncbi:MAG: hypothetical protein J6X55_06405, partial [Victivallales bacterium]|nr:hypothetical protein [Victivallales bacterium]